MIDNYRQGLAPLSQQARLCCHPSCGFHLRFVINLIKNTDEYGNIQDPDDFKNILSYSPLHQVKDDVNYPATLIMTSENDDRVPPFHSYKFAARLQNRIAQNNPVLLRVEKDAGHMGAESSYKDIIKEEADMYDFILYYLLEK